MLYNSRTPARLAFVFATTLVLLVGGSALAFDGFTVGAGTSLPYRGLLVLNATAVQPIVDFERHFEHEEEALQLSARADVSYGVGLGLPALAAGAVLSSAGSYEIERYLGISSGISFAGNNLADPALGLLFYGGVRLPVTSGLHSAVEVQLAATGYATVPSVNLALEYTFGGGK